MAAAGFAIGDVTLTDCLSRRNLLPDTTPTPDITAILGGEDERLSALHDLAELRRAGFSIVYPLKNQSFNKQFKNADKSGASIALVYGEEELAAGKVRIRNLATREETLTLRSQLAEELKALL